MSTGIVSGAIKGILEWLVENLGSVVEAIHTLTEYKESMDNAGATVEKAEERARRARRDVDEALSALHALQGRVKAMIDGVRREEQEARRRLVELRARQSRLQLQLQELQRRRQEVVNELQEVESRLEEAKNTLQQRLQELGDTRDALEKAREDYKKYASLARRLKAEAEKIRAAIEKLSRPVTVSAGGPFVGLAASYIPPENLEKINMLKQRYEDIASKLKEYGRAAEQAAKQAEELELKLRHLERSIAAYRKTIASLEAEKNRLEREEKMLDQAYARLQGELEKLSSALDSLQDRIQLAGQLRNTLVELLATSSAAAKETQLARASIDNALREARKFSHKLNKTSNFMEQLIKEIRERKARPQPVTKPRRPAAEKTKESKKTRPAVAPGAAVKPGRHYPGLFRLL